MDSNAIMSPPGYCKSTDLNSPTEAQNSLNIRKYEMRQVPIEYWEVKLFEFCRETSLLPDAIDVFALLSQVHPVMKLKGKDLKQE